MRSTVLSTIFVLGAAGTLAAQVPAGTPPAPGARRGATAGMLLARTGELQLTDQQVVRLAAIARRSDARRQSLRSALDSARQRFSGSPTPADSAARRQFRDQMRANMQRAQEQEHADRRDAIAVLTPDQQARAWEMAAGRGRGMRAGMRQRAMNGARGMRAPRGMRERAMRERDEVRRRARRP